MKKLLIAVVCLSSLLSVHKQANAQQDAMYSMYMFNGLAINPAYAGSRERTAIMALYRHQWTGLPGAPKTAVLSGHGTLANENIGLGMSLVSDNHSIFNTITLTGNYAYRIQFKNNSRLSLGVNVALNNFRANWSELLLSDEADEIFTSAKKNVVSPNFGAGLYYYSEKFYAGFSIPHFLNMSLSEHFRAEGTDMVARQWKHYFYTMGAVFNLGENVKFKPSLLLKHVKNSPFQANINAAFLFKEALWVGASYRTGDAVVLMTEYNFSKGIRIGYAYDITMTELNDYSSGTHEIMVAYEFLKKETYLSPRRMSYF
jgi:type IX secretion system PorP/SprF family membrane protein